MKYKVITYITALLFLSLFSLGQEISTVGEIYDFEIGDEFHKWGMNDFDEYYQWMLIDKIINKAFSTNNDTVFYTIYRQYSESTTSNPGWTYHDTTIVERYTELDLPINNGEIDSVYSDSTWFNERLINSSELDDYEWYALKWFVNGCGQAHYFYFDIYANQIESWLVYFNKNGEEYGEPIVITNDSEFDFYKPELIVYPNPSFEKIFIKHGLNNSKSQTIEIFNLQGHLVERITKLTEMNNCVDITKLPSGIYFLKLTSESNTLETKFIKR